jgi:hypothetical protein
VHGLTTLSSVTFDHNSVTDPAFQGWNALPAKTADMKLIAEYVERAEHFEKLADGEADPVLKDELLKQAAAYRKLARKRAALLGTKPR